MTGTRDGRDDAELRQEHEEGRPDFARGQERAEIHPDRPDFARGQRQDTTYQQDGNVAQGQADLEDHPETHDDGDFARGQRQDDPDRPRTSRPPRPDGG